MFKSLSSDNYTIRPFTTHKTQTYTYISGSTSNSLDIRIDLAQAPPSGWTFSPSTEIQNSDGIFQSTLYKSVINTFYRSASLLPFTVTQSRAPMNFSAAGDPFRNFSPSSSFYVFNISQMAFGEGIRPGSFSIFNPTSSFAILDDGLGRLVISSSGTSTVVGNIFYNLGVAVISSTTSDSITTFLTPVEDDNVPQVPWGPKLLVSNLSGSEYTGYVSSTFVSSSIPVPSSSLAVNAQVGLQTSSVVPISASLIYNAFSTSSTSSSPTFVGLISDTQIGGGDTIFGQIMQLITGSWNHYEFPISQQNLSYLTGSNGGSGQNKNYITFNIFGNAFTCSVSMSSMAIKAIVPVNFINATPLNITFDSTQTIYNHRIICSIDPSEYTYSSNPSTFVTNSLGEKIPDLFLSGGLLPYTTTIGLYDRDYELVAIAKVPNPVKRLTETEQSFIISLDA